MLPLLVPLVYSSTEFDATANFHLAIDMANEQGAGGCPPPALPAGISSDMMALIAMLQQQYIDGMKQQTETITRQQDALAALQVQFTDALRTLGDKVK
jgi:hypothetical protein